jgi:hypothetical protein
LTDARREEIGGTAASRAQQEWQAAYLAAHAADAVDHRLSPRRDGVDILFGSKRGFTTWTLNKKALDEKLGLPSLVHHDIRRSVSTGMLVTAHLSDGLFSVLGEIPVQRANYRLAQLVTRAAQSSVR